jgi:hypothetical protein
MLVSKIQTYLSGKMHLKKVITNKHAKLGLSPKQFLNACSGLPTHRHNYCKMLEFANKKFVQINSPYCILGWVEF